MATSTKRIGKKATKATGSGPIDPFESLAVQPVELDAAPKPARRKTATTVTKKSRSAKASVTSKMKTAKPAAPVLHDLDVAPTPPVKRKVVRKSAKKPAIDATAEIAAAEPEVELSASFKTLAAPELPELARENRARLLMQSPTELYFYWSIRKDPYHILRDAFGETGSYTLVLKLNDLRRGTEDIHRVEAEGNWWFTVEPDGEYRAEIGFYAPNRPYFRIVYSNTVETPRRSPSPRSATQADWKVTAHKFAEVLDVAGFAQDALDVAMAGDDHLAAQNAAHTAFARFIGLDNGHLESVAAEDIRYTMVALAAGLRLEDLRWRISPAMFAILQANPDSLDADKAKTVLTEHFDIDETEFVEEHYGSAVHGASLVNFPRTLKPRRFTSRYSPLSSHSLR